MYFYLYILFLVLRRTHAECALKVHKTEGKSKLSNFYDNFKCTVALTMIWRFWDNQVHLF